MGVKVIRIALFRKATSICLAIVLIQACIEPIDPQSLGFDDLLVVEALITDQSIQQEVRLSRTNSINSEILLSETGATVWMIDQNEQRIEFSEVENGVYLTSSSYAAEVGGNLQLFIETESGRSYRSDVVDVVATSTPDSIYANFTPVPVQSNLFGGRFDFYVDARSNELQNRYFRWSTNFTYELSVKSPSRWLLEDGEFVIRERGSENDSLQVEICWQSFAEDGLNLLELQVPSNGIEQLPIQSFHSEVGYMKKGFSIELILHGLSQESYLFWQKIEETSQNQSSLADTQPGTIVGNVKSLTNPSEIVLGIFEASQETSVRRQFNRDEFDKDGFKVIRTDLIECDGLEPQTSGKTVEEVQLALDELGPEWVLAYFGTSNAFYLPKRCSVCTEYGTNQRPKFWK